MNDHRGISIASLVICALGGFLCLPGTAFCDKEATEILPGQNLTSEKVNAFKSTSAGGPVDEDIKVVDFVSSLGLQDKNCKGCVKDRGNKETRNIGRQGKNGTKRRSGVRRNARHQRSPGRRVSESAVHSNQSLTTSTRSLYGFDDWFPPKDESFNIKQAPTGLKDSALRNRQHGQDRLQDKYQLGNRSWASSFHKKSLNNHKHQINQTNKKLQDSLSQGTANSSADKTEVYSSADEETSSRISSSVKPLPSTEKSSVSPSYLLLDGSSSDQSKNENRLHQGLDKTNERMMQQGSVEPQGPSKQYASKDMVLDKSESQVWALSMQLDNTRNLFLTDEKTSLKVEKKSSQVKKNQSTKPIQSTSHRKAKLDNSRASHQASKLDNLQNVKENSLKNQRLSKSSSNRKRKVQGHTNGRVAGAVGPLTVKKKGDEGNAPNLPDIQDSEKKYGSQNQRKNGSREKIYDTDVINAGDTESKPTSRMMSALIPSRGFQGRAGELFTRTGDLPEEMYSDSVRRPPAVDRLERRLLGSISDSARRLLVSVKKMLEILNNELERMHDKNKFIFNGTRYVIMMGVREHLQEVALANNIVYDTMLRAALLTKDIYNRAHHSRLTNSPTSLTRPELRGIPVMDALSRKATDEERMAKSSLRSLKSLAEKFHKLKTRMREVRNNFRQKFESKDVRNVVDYVNATWQRLNREFVVSINARYSRRNKAVLLTCHGNISLAKDLLAKANDHIAQGEFNYRGSYSVVMEWRQQKENDDGVGAPVSLRQRPPIIDRSSEERRRIQPIITKLQNHAKDLEQRANDIERLLRPALRRAENYSTRQSGKLFTHLNALTTQLLTDINKLISSMNSIRVLIGFKQELKWNRDLPESEDSEGTGDDECVACWPEGSGYAPEGTLAGGEGSGTLPPPTTDDEDFEFVDERQTLKPHTDSSLEQFGRALTVHLEGVVLKSRNVSRRADQVARDTKDLSRRWAKIKETIDVAEKAYNNWKLVQTMITNVTYYADEISDLARLVHAKANKSHDIQRRMSSAVKLAERKLKEAQENNSGSDDVQPEVDRPLNDDTDVTDVVNTVKAVRLNKEAIFRLRTVAPQACGRATAQLRSLHANISHLRQQVDRARSLLESLHLSISKKSGGFLSIPLRSDDSSQSLTTSVEMCVKTEKDGHVLLLKGNNSGALSVSVDSKQISVDIFSSEGKSLGTVTSSLTMTANKWYNVKVVRFGWRVSLQVASKDSAEVEEDDVSISAVSMPIIQGTPLRAFVGGVPENEVFSVGSEFWEGCLGGLQVNRRALSLFHASSDGSIPQLCSEQCTSMNNKISLVFEGAGFLHFPATVLPTRMRMESVNFRFRTRQPSAALLRLVNQRQKFLLRVVLTDGAIMLDTTTPSESIILRSQNSYYNDGKFHTLTIKYRDTTTYPEIDGMDGKFTIERGQPYSLSEMADGVIVGALVTSGHIFEQSQYRPLIGCIQDLRIDRRPLSLAQAVVARGVFEGTCNLHGLWSGCVQFGVESQGMDLGSLTDSATVALLFSPDIRGPLLTYSRREKFDMEVRATDTGLDVTRVDEDTTKILTRPNDVTEDFSLLTITDDGKNVDFKAWGKDVNFYYAGFWGTLTDVKGTHDITVAMTDDDSQKQLSGSLAQLIVGKRYIDLGNYTLSNNLLACTRPLPNTATLEISPGDKSPRMTTQAPGHQCSTDIRC